MPQYYRILTNTIILYVDVKSVQAADLMHGKYCVDLLGGIKAGKKGILPPRSRHVNCLYIIDKVQSHSRSQITTALQQRCRIKNKGLDSDSAVLPDTAVLTQIFFLTVKSF